MALLPSVQNARTSNLMIGSAFGLMGWSFLATNASDSFPGLAAAPAVLGAALIVWPKRSMPLDRVLSNSFMTKIGLISYSLYLWHWPVLVLYRHYNNGQMPGLWSALSLTLLSVALAYGTWRFVEPVRYRRLPTVPTIASGMAAMTTTAFLASAINLSGGVLQRVPAAANMQSLDQMWEWKCPAYASVPLLGGSQCTFGAEWETASSRTIIWGDSHAEHMAPLVEAAGADSGRSFLLFRACSAIFGDKVRGGHPHIVDYAEQCVDFRNQIADYAHSDDRLDSMILASAWVGAGNVAVTDTQPAGTGGIQKIAAGLEDMIASLPNRLIYIAVGQIPQTVEDSAACQIGMLRTNCGSIPSFMASEYRRLIAPIDHALNSVAQRHPNFIALHPGRALCSETQCQIALNDEPLYRDSNHIRRNLSFETRSLLAEQIGLSRAVRALPVAINEVGLAR